MTTWKYTDADNRVVSRTTENGGTESCLVSAINEWIAAGNTPLPYEPPPAPKVESVLMVQARKALILAGVSLIEIESIIDKMPGIQRDLARADWDTAPTVHRDNALVAYIAKIKDWSSEFVDDLFAKAASIKA